MLETCTLECIDKCQKALYHCSVLLPESLSSCLPCPFGAFTVSPEFRPFTVMKNQGLSTSIKLHSVLYLIFIYFTRKSRTCQLFSEKIIKIFIRFALSLKGYNGCARSACILWCIAKALDLFISL